jgi:hypothetical protein
MLRTSQGSENRSVEDIGSKLSSKYWIDEFGPVELEGCTYIFSMTPVILKCYKGCTVIEQTSSA